MRIVSLFVVLLISIPGCLAVDVGNAATAADSAYERKNWTEAETLYEQLTRSNPDMPRYWYRLGVSAHAAGHQEKAVQALAQAKSKGAPAMNVDYKMAAAHASMGDTEKALAELKDAMQGGFASPEQLTSDSEFASLRSDPRFPPLVEQAKHNQAPCEYSAESRQFDFWIGDWDVSPTAGGLPQGDSHIEKTLGGCVIWENWKSRGNGYAGKSYNTYNTSLKRWEQFWVDNAGGMIHFYGNVKDGVMDFYTEDMPQPDGTSLRRHLQFFNLGPDKVRQFSQGSTDGGKSWRVEYDFTYVRKKSPGA